MTIMSSYQLPNMLRQRKRANAIEAVAKQVNEPSAASTEAQAQLAASHEQQAAGIEAGDSDSLKSLAVPAGALAPAADESDDEAYENTAIALQRVMSDLERRGELHDETMKLIEAVPEWRNYDSHVSFELTMLRHRYQTGDIPMTSQRRNQMQTHLRKAQQEVMELHAERAAQAFVESLTPSEAEELRKRLLRIDPGGLELVEDGKAGQKEANEEVGALPDGGVDFDKMKTAMWEVSKALAGEGGARAGAGGRERAVATGGVGQSGDGSGAPGAGSTSGYTPRMVGQRRK